MTYRKEVTLKMKFSHSRVECFKNCPYQFKLRYIDELETLDDYEASDPLTVGTALHRGIETDVKTAIKSICLSGCPLRISVPLFLIRNRLGFLLFGLLWLLKRLKVIK